MSNTNSSQQLYYTRKLTFCCSSGRMFPDKHSVCFTTDAGTNSGRQRVSPWTQYFNTTLQRNSRTLNWQQMKTVSKKNLISMAYPWTLLSSHSVFCEQY